MGQLYTSATSRCVRVFHPLARCAAKRTKNLPNALGRLEKHRSLDNVIVAGAAEDGADVLEFAFLYARFFPSSRVTLRRSLPLIVTNSERMRTVQIALSLFRDEYQTQWNLLMASTTIMVLPLLALFVFTQRYFIEGIVSSGVKG